MENNTPCTSAATAHSSTSPRKLSNTKRRKAERLYLLILHLFSVLLAYICDLNEQLHGTDYETPEITRAYKAINDAIKVNAAHLNNPHDIKYFLCDYETVRSTLDKLFKL